MAKRATVLLNNPIIITRLSDGAIPAYGPVKFGSDDDHVVSCDSNDADMIGFCHYAVTAAEKEAHVILFGSMVVIPVTVAASSTATAGKNAVGVASAGTFKNCPTIGGGSNVAYIRGKFVESGVAGDKVGLLIAGPAQYVLTA